MLLGPHTRAFTKAVTPFSLGSSLTQDLARVLPAAFLQLFSSSGIGQSIFCYHPCPFFASLFTMQISRMHMNSNLIKGGAFRRGKICPAFSSVTFPPGILEFVYFFQLNIRQEDTCHKNFIGVLCRKNKSATIFPLFFHILELFQMILRVGLSENISKFLKEYLKQVPFILKKSNCIFETV